MFESLWIKAQHVATYAYDYIDSRTIYYTVIAIIGIAYTYHLVLLKENPDAPPLVKSWIPFFGTAFSFMRNPEKYVLQCRQRYGDMFTLYMTGKRLHVVCDPFIGIPSVYNREKTFCFSAVSRGFGLRYFGQSEKLLDHTEFGAANRALFVPLLLAQDQVNILITEFNKNLQPIILREINELQRQGKFGENGQSFSMDIWICKVMFECSGKTFYGETWPNDEKFFQDWKTWDDGLYPILKGYPSIFTRKAMLARERYYERLVDMFKRPLVGPSKLIRAKVELAERFGYPIEESTREQIGVAFATQTNAIAAAFWVVAYLTCLPNPEERREVLDRIQQYVIQEESDQNRTSFRVSELLQDPVLNAALSETLRLQMNSMLPRTVLQDATVTAGEKTYAVQRDDTVFIVMASVHKNPDIYDEPYEFQLKRFMALHDKSGIDQYQSSTKFSTKSGAQIRNPFIWWGGGQHICSGRKFAIGEILLLVATLLHQFELTSVTGDGPPNPPSAPSISRYGGGMEFPAVPWQVRMKYRTT